MSKYKVIAICGKSAAGKDTFLKYLIQQPNVHEIISCTTRPPREGEVDGVNYYFLTLEDFAAKDCCGGMLEISKFRGWFYGTPIDALDKDKINIGVFNPTGIYSLMHDNLIELYVVEVIASDKVRLLRSLHREENPDVDEIIRRYSTDKQDFENFTSFCTPNFCILNNDSLSPEGCAALCQEVLDDAARHWANSIN